MFRGGMTDSALLAEDLADYYRVHGSWERPDFKPDLQGVDTNHAIEAAKEIGKQLKGKDAGEFVDELVRKGPNGEPSKVQKFLDKLFKQ